MHAVGKGEKRQPGGLSAESGSASSLLARKGERSPLQGLRTTIERTDHSPERKEEFIVDRYTVTMRHERLGFLLCSFEELCFALLCPDQTREKDLKRRML